MADSNIIRDVSVSLKNFIQAALADVDPLPSVVLHDPVAPTNTAPLTVSLFLYEVVEDPCSRNRPRVQETNGNQVTLRRAAMALALRYLITPWAVKAEDEQIILGRILLAFHDDAILTGPDLSPPLDISNEALKVTLFSLSLEERSRIWYALEKPFKLALTYEVRVVNIDSKRPVNAAAVRGGDVRSGQKEGPA